jgi:hypothetical protein
VGIGLLAPELPVENVEVAVVDVLVAGETPGPERWAQHTIEADVVSFHGW